MVSVIIPTFNREKTIMHSVQSVLNQTYSDLEVIVVDDASEDNTKEIFAQIDDKRVKYVANIENKGVAEARNEGVRHAKGEYIAFQDSDDIWKKDKLEKQMNVMSENVDCKFVYSAFNIIYREGKIARIPSLDKKIEELQGNIFGYLLQRNTISTQTMLLTRELFEEMGGFCSGLRALDDYDFALRVAKKYPIYYVDEELVDVFESSNSINILSKNALAHYEAILNIVKTHWHDVQDKNKFKNLVSNLISFSKYLPYSRFQKVAVEMQPFIYEGMDLACCIGEIRRLSYKDLMMQEMIDRRGININKYLSKYGIEKLAVYGYGYVGKYLCNLCEEFGCQIEYIIDINCKEAKYRIFTMSDTLPDTDLIVVSIYDGDRTLKQEIANKTHTKVVFLDELLEE